MRVCLIYIYVCVIYVCVWYICVCVIYVCVCVFYYSNFHTISNSMLLRLFIFEMMAFLITASDCPRIVSIQETIIPDVLCTGEIICTRSKYSICICKLKCTVKCSLEHLFLILLKIQIPFHCAFQSTSLSVHL